MNSEIRPPRHEVLAERREGSQSVLARVQVSRRLGLLARHLLRQLGVDGDLVLILGVRRFFEGQVLGELDVARESGGALRFGF